MPLKRVILGTDFSNPSLSAVHWVAHHLAPDAEVVLAHVIPLPRVPSFLRDGLPAPDHLLEHVSSATQHGLRALAESLGAVRCVIEVRVGDAADQLAALADEHEADLIAIGRTGERARRTKHLGTTADRLARRAPVPVLLAGGALAAPPRRILAAIDEAEIGLDVLTWARRLGSADGASLTTLHVLSDRVRAYLAATAAGNAEAPEREKALRGAAHGWLRKRLAAAGIDPAATTSVVTIGDPRHEILAAAGCFGADLIVVGRQGIHGDAEPGLGGVTRAALRPTRHSVLVVPPTAGRSSDSPNDRKRRFLTVAPATPRGRLRMVTWPDRSPPAA